MAKQPVSTGQFNLARALIWVFVRFDGRISRQVYWLGNAALFAISAIFLRPTVDADTGAVALHLNSFGYMMIFAAMASSLAIGAKRLHDFNISALFTVVLVLPASSVLATLVIGLVPGTPGANRYGVATDRMP